MNNDNEETEKLTVSQAKRLINSDNDDASLIAEGFHKLDDNLIEKRPPKIKWGRIYVGFTKDEKIEYLEGLAATMNHAARLIQDERNKLGELIEKKEKRVESARASMDQNMNMIQGQVTQMNEERQRWNDEAKAYNQKIRELTERLANAGTIV